MEEFQVLTPNFLICVSKGRYIGLRYVLALILLLSVLLGSTASAATPQVMTPDAHYCITDPAGWYQDSEEKVRKRFDIYKSVGCDMLRVEIDWRSLEREEGKWEYEPICRYLKLAKEYGFRIKLIVGVMMAPPKWYLEKHPDAMLTDQNGGHSYNTMSYWYPGLHKVIDEKTKKLFDILNTTGVWDSVDYLIPSFGPAGEPIYPHPWTLGPDFPVVTFWGYDANAQKSFRKAMKRKYQDVEQANAAWGTHFAAWNDVTVLKPKSKPGAYWNDMLTWYRDSKREFVKWQIDELRRLSKSEKQILMYVPGTCYTDQEWADAVRIGDGSDMIKLMADSMFLVDIAAKKKCWLQYTGVENGPEVDRLRAYLDKRKYSGVEMWGENAGYYECAKDPEALAAIIIRNRLYGLDLTHGHFLFERDGITPNEVMPKLKRAYGMIKEYWAGRRAAVR